LKTLFFLNNAIFTFQHHLKSVAAEYREQCLYSEPKGFEAATQSWTKKRVKPSNVGGHVSEKHPWIP
jgi:hypothetical protein